MSESKDRPPEDEDEVRPDEDAAAPEDDGAAGESDPARSAVQIIDRRGDGATSGGPPVPTPPDPTVDEALLDDLISDEVPAQDDVEDGAEAAGAGAGMEDDGAEAALAPEPPARPRGPENLVSVLESLLFVADRPLSIRDLKAACGRFVKTADIRDAIETIAGDYAHGDRGIVLIEVASGWQFRSNPQNREWVHRFLAVKPQRLSRAALETLAIIAYRQPITRAEIEKVRGVGCGPVLRGLLDRGLAKIAGRAEQLGSPLLYGTTARFLEHFGLNSLRDLPRSSEFRSG